VTSGVGAYAAGENHDPDGDSDGTAIVVSQPVDNTPPVATFTYSCTDLTCDFDGSGSYDPDGSIVSYDWDFGDGNTGGGATASHTYDVEGSYTVVLTVTDDGGATDTDTQNVPVGNIPTMHVGDLEGIGQAVRSKWEATVTITVHEQDHTPLANAVVAGTWSSGATGGAVCTTDGSGQCSVTVGNLKFDVTSVTFTVDSVTLAGYSYAPADNHDPDGGDGTSITVYAP